MSSDGTKQKTRINTMFYTGFCTLSDGKKQSRGAKGGTRTPTP